MDAPAVPQARPPADLERDLARAITRVLSAHFGRDPASASAMLSDDYAFVVTDTVLTRIERRLIEAGEASLVRRMRFAFEDVMTGAFATAVEHVVGRTVVAYHSQVFLERDSAIELFVLDPAQPGLASAGAQAPTTPEAVDPGTVGDVDRLPSPGANEAARPVMARPSGRAGLSGVARDRLGRDIAQLAQRVFGRGAARVRVFELSGYVICGLDEALLPHELVLLDGQCGDLVREARQSLVDACADDLRVIVARHTGLELREARIQVVRDPDSAFLTLDCRSPDGPGRTPG